MFKYKLNNFRSFDNEEFDFKRINVLIGENSGGKSSLLKSILALKQTLESPSLSNLILNGRYTDLGNFNETIYNQDDKLDLEFRFSYGREQNAFVETYIFDDLELVKIAKKKKELLRKSIEEALNFETSFSVKFSKKLNTHQAIKVEFINNFLGQINIVFDKDSEETRDNLFRERTCTIEYFRNSTKELIELSDIEFSKSGFFSMIEPSSLKKACIKRKEHELFYEIAVLLLTQNLTENYLDNIEYINPLASTPKRIYMKKDSQSDYEGTGLDKFMNMVINNQVSKSDLTKFSRILRNYGIAENLEVLESPSMPVSELRVKIENLVSNIYDVGFGVSLQIPILFEAFIGENHGGKTFIIEQPELHLHPSLQARFIKTLLEMGESNSYIIETHSEHMVRMLQLLVKNSEHNISNEDVQIYYFKRGEEKFEVSNHNLGVNGEMNETFPSGFYDVSYQLTKQMLF
ncbi:MAG: DUF3696 domain-containing protein [Vicingaceae bacterium]